MSVSERVCVHSCMCVFKKRTRITASILKQEPKTRRTLKTMLIPVTKITHNMLVFCRNR